MRYSLRQLEVFLATAQHENVTRAASSLAMSQSAASGSLKDLEQREIEGFVQRIKALDGVHEISVYEVDRVAYLKVDKGFDEAKLQALVTH